MANVIIGDLQHVEQLLAAQGAGGIDTSGQRNALATSMMQRISQMPTMTIPEATNLTNAINAGHWSVAHRTNLLNAVSSVVNNAVSACQTATTPQTLNVSSNYLTRSDVNFATDPANSCIAKRDLFLTRMRGGGLHNPSETTRGHLAATIIILCGYDVNSMTAIDKFNIVKELKAQLALPRNVPRAVPFVRDYPTDPQNLPAAVFQNMFPDPNDPPVSMQLVGLSALVATIPLRESHRAIRGSSALVHSRVACASGANGGMNASLGMDHRMLGMLVSRAQAQGNLHQVLALMNGPSDDGMQPDLPGFRRGGRAALTVGPSSGHGLTPPRLGRASTSCTLRESTPDQMPDLGDGTDAPPAPVAGPNAAGPSATRITTGASDATAAPPALPAQQHATASQVDGLISRAQRAFDSRKDSTHEPPSKKQKLVAGLLKRPAAAKAAAKAAKVAEPCKARTLSKHEPPRPKVPHVGGKKQLSPIKWFNGTVYISTTKEAFRVLRAPGQAHRVDISVAWSRFPTLAAAWTEALNIISEAQVDLKK